VTIPIGIPIGIAHVAGDYTFPSGSGTQFSDGCDAIFTPGFRTLKVYLTGAYLTDYPLQTVWSSVPTNLSQLAATTQFATQFARDWEQIVLTTFTFVNGTTNWWRADVSVAKMQAEYTEMYNLASYLLTTYNGTGKKFIFQNWEGDWAFMDSFSPDTHVNEWLVHNYVAFLGTRQRAIRDARRAINSDVQIQMAFETNRVLDARQSPHMRRILRDIAPRIQPDIISYSAYDSTIVQQGVWGASYAAWLAATTPTFTKALQSIATTFPGVPISIGEFGYPENEAPIGRNCGDMVTATYNLAVATGLNIKHFIFWEVFDNEEISPGVPRGFFTVKPGGVVSDSGVALAALL